MKIFISYTKEDIDIANKLYADLQEADLKPWMDKKNILPGQKWKQIIPKIINKCDLVIILMSSKSILRRGYFHTELRSALNVLNEMPPHSIFIIPVRIDNCNPAYEELKDIHWVDIFPSYENGFSKILNTINKILESVPKYKSAYTRKIGDEIRVLENLYEKLTIKGSDKKELFDIENKIKLLNKKILQGPNLEEGFILSARYKLIECIGTGGFATVWKAYDKKNRKLAAIKVLHGHLSRDDSQRDRFFSWCRNDDEFKSSKYYSNY